MIRCIVMEPTCSGSSSLTWHECCSEEEEEEEEEERQAAMERGAC
jgi:hypothetical protein